MDKDFGEAAPGTSPASGASPSARSLSIKTPLSTARKSRCGNLDGVPILERVERRRAAARDGPDLGMSPRPSPKRTVLNDLPDSYFVNVAYSGFRWIMGCRLRMFFCLFYVLMNWLRRRWPRLRLGSHRRCRLSQTAWSSGRPRFRPSRLWVRLVEASLPLVLLLAS